MDTKELIKMVDEYFDMLDVEKRFPSAGFAKPRRDAENKLRKIIKQSKVEEENERIDKKKD